MLFGTSIPTSDFPGIGASIRIVAAARARARLSCNPTILESFTPSAGFIAYLVTVGPMVTSSISTSIPKFRSVLFIIFAFAFISPTPGFPLSFSRRESGGGVYAFPRASIGIDFPIKASSSDASFFPPKMPFFIGCSFFLSSSISFFFSSLFSSGMAIFTSSSSVSVTTSFFFFVDLNTFTKFNHSLFICVSKIIRREIATKAKRNATEEYTSKSFMRGDAISPPTSPPRPTFPISKSPNPETKNIAPPIIFIVGNTLSSDLKNAMPSCQIYHKAHNSKSDSFF